MADMPVFNEAEIELIQLMLMKVDPTGIMLIGQGIGRKIQEFACQKQEEQNATATSPQQAEPE